MFENIEAYISGDKNETLKNGFDKEFSGQFESFLVDNPELIESRSIIEKGAKDLSEKFGIHPEMLNDRMHFLLFMAISERNGRLEEELTGGLSPESYSAEKEFIFDATALIASENSDLYPSYAESISSEKNLNDEDERLTYDRYTNEKVSLELETAINSELLDDVKKRMGVTSENETPYKIRVLNVASDFSLAGMSPKISSDLELLPRNDPLWAEYYKKDKEYSEYVKNLKANAESFKLDQHNLDDIPVAWKTVIDGVNNLILPLPFAEKLLNRQNNSSDTQLDNDRLNSDMSILEHEYTHTQGGLLSKDESLIGITAEEFRAEKFSLNRQGFDDVKTAIMMLNVIGIFDLDQVMDDREKGGTLEDIIMEMIPYIGLQRTLEFCLTPPSTYAESKESPLLSNVAKYLGGLDGFIKRVYADAMDSPRAGRVDRRLMEMATIMKGDGNDFDGINRYLDKVSNDGLPYGASLFRAKLQELDK